MKPSWRGLFAGILGTGWISIFLLYNLDFIPRPFPYNLRIESALLAGGTLLIVLMTSRTVSRPIEFAGLILGLLIGYLLEFFILILPTYWGGGGSGMIIPYVWISAVFFPELLGGRVDKRGVGVWLGFAFIAFVILQAVS